MNTTTTDTTLENSAVEIVPLSQHIGAEIRGVDIGGDLTDAEVAAIRAALLEWKVVFFRGQDLDRDSHVAFGKRFGEVPRAHPTLLSKFPENPEILLIEKDASGGDDESRLQHRWHTDVTYVESPPMASILRAIDVPPYGADTEWTNLAAAYRTLSEPLRTLIDGLTAVHHNVLHLVRGEPTPLMISFESKKLRAVHPVVSVHPETDEPVIYVNPDFTSHIVELSRQESAHILACLYEHMTSHEFTVRFNWEPGSVAFWDNRATAHLAPADVPGNYHRLMERITLRGTKQVGPSGFVSKGLVTEA
ncbi:MAG: TauD/TfdA family dioxygenase [Acidimicrobiales bacterium]